MVQSPSWEANWSAASQETLRISRNPKVYYRTHKRPPPVSILGQPNPVHIHTSKCVFKIFSSDFCLKHFSSLEEWSEMWSNVMHFGLHVKYPLFLHILIKLEFSRQIFQNTQISNFMKIRHSSGSRVVSCGQTYRWTDRYDEASSHFS